jgi:hypothetical protein
MVAIEEVAVGSVLGALTALSVVALVFVLIFALALYVYTAYTLMKIGQRRKVKYAWLAWIPIGNLYVLVKAADKHGAWTLFYLLGIIPVVGQILIAALTVFLFYRVAEKLKFNPLFSLLVLVPIGNLVLLGLLAWSKPIN